jgi:acetate kinase
MVFREGREQSVSLYFAAMEPESVKVLVVPTNEDLKIAQETKKAIERRFENDSRQ